MDERVSIPRQSRGLYPANAGLAPQRGLIAIGQNQNRTVIAQSMIVFLLPSFLRKQESSVFWIPGRVALARNDDPTPENVNPVLDTGPPAEPGVYLDANEEAMC